jgi:hypothetical protein
MQAVEWLLREYRNPFEKVDRGIVASRKPDDIPAFSRKLIEEIGEGRHARERSAA